FSFILFYEVLMLIASIPQSTTRSIAKQYEIVSLIFVRRFFKDIADMDNIGKLAQITPEVVPVLLDVAAGLFMFLLVTVFMHAAAKRTPTSNTDHSEALKAFIVRKKAIAVLLAVLLLSLGVYSLAIFVQATPGQHDPNTFYYTDVFSAMIFTD